MADKQKTKKAKQNLPGNQSVNVDQCAKLFDLQLMLNLIYLTWIKVENLIEKFLHPLMLNVKEWMKWNEKSVPFIWWGQLNIITCN